MTVSPIPSEPSEEDNFVSEGTPIIALKELVARLYREQNKIQNLLSSLGFALRSFNNLNQFLELTPLMAARVTDAEGGALILFNAQGQIRLEQLHCHNSKKGEQISQKLAKVSKTLTLTPSNPQGTAKILLPCPAAVDEHIRKALGTDIQVFGTPILVKNAERGRLYIFSSHSEYQWNSTRRKLLQLVSDQTAVAIANHELTVQLRAKERQDRELEIASEIQLRLFPRQCPKIKGTQLAAKCKTASRVGGDYYDFIPVNYDQLNSQDNSVPWSIVIGDVMGKGVPAGLIMTMTRGMLRAEVLNRHSPAQIMQHLNRVMYDDLDNSRRFVTLFYSEYDPKTQIMSYTNAAHNPPLLWQATTGLIKALDTKGMLIGLVPDSEYEYAEVQLAPGDTIMYYTDGFTDAVNNYGERFDEDNLHRAFAWACQNLEKPQEILDYLFQEVDNFIGSGNKIIDDMTLVIMRIQSNLL